MSSYKIFFLDIFNTNDRSAVGGLKFFKENTSARRQVQFFNEVQSLAKKADTELAQTGLPLNRSCHAKWVKELVGRKKVEIKTSKENLLERQKSGELTKKESKLLKKKAEKLQKRKAEMAAGKERKIQKKLKKKAEKRIKEKEQKQLPPSYKIYDVSKNNIQKIPILPERKSDEKRSNATERKTFFAASRQQYAQQREQFFINFQRENGRPAKMKEWDAFVNQRD